MRKSPLRSGISSRQAARRAARSRFALPDTTGRRIGISSSTTNDVQITATGPIRTRSSSRRRRYWFGAKGRAEWNARWRVVSAKIVIPADMPPGPILWQAANANGATSTGTFVVGAGTEVVEDERRKAPQLLPALPVTVSGRIAKIEEVDRYRFIAAKNGPITLDVMSRRIGAKFLAILEVRDSSDRLIADVAGANGQDPFITFAATAGAEYVVGLRDIDFGGDRSYVYRLGIAAGPHVVGAIPAAGKRGETREVEFVGYGVATGAPKLESIKREVAFPKDDSATSFPYRLDTPWGVAAPWPLLLSDLPELVSPPGGTGLTLTAPSAVTGALDRLEAEDRISCAGKRAMFGRSQPRTRRVGSPLDVSIAVLGPDGKETHSERRPAGNDRCRPGIHGPRRWHLSDRRQRHRRQDRLALRHLPSGSATSQKRFRIATGAPAHGSQYWRAVAAWRSRRSARADSRARSSSAWMVCRRVSTLTPR